MRAVWPEAAGTEPVFRVELFHRPRQLESESSLAATIIWRNLLLGADANRIVDLDETRRVLAAEIGNIIKDKEAGRF